MATETQLFLDTIIVGGSIAALAVVTRHYAGKWYRQGMAEGWHPDSPFNPRNYLPEDKLRWYMGLHERPGDVPYSLDGGKTWCTRNGGIIKRKHVSDKVCGQELCMPGLDGKCVACANEE